MVWERKEFPKYNVKLKMSHHQEKHINKAKLFFFLNLDMDEQVIQDFIHEIP